MDANMDAVSELREIRLEAARWVLRLEDEPSDPGASLSDRGGGNGDLLDWLVASPRNVRAFLEVYETDRRLWAVARAGLRDRGVGQRPGSRSRQSG